MRSPVSVSVPVLAVALLCLTGTAIRGAEHSLASQPDIAAEAEVPGSVESDLNAAVSLLLQGETEAAIDIVRPHLPGDVRAVDLLFDAGMAMAVSAQSTPPPPPDAQEALLDASIALFRAILAAHPDHVRVRLELARAFFLRGRDGLARRQFELALASDPPAPVVANINRFLAEIRARSRWSGYLGMALAPDTNIGGASADDTVTIDTSFGELDFTRDWRQTSGVGVSVWAGGEYQQPLAPAWRLRMGGDVFRREYEGSEFDSMGLGGHVGPRWLAGPRTEASLLLTTRREWQGNDQPTSRSLGLRMEAFRRLSPRLSGQLGASWSARRHNGSTHLDGPRKDISAGIRWSVTPVLQTDLRAGWVRERPEFRDLRSRTQRASLGASAALPRGFSVSGTFTGRWADYEGPGSVPRNVLSGADRRDITRTIRLSGLKRDLTIRGFSPQLSVTHERRTSNAQQTDYRRTGGEIGFVRQF